MTFRHAADTEAPVPEIIERIAEIIVDGIYTIHSEIGPGLMEDAWEPFLADELRSRGLEVAVQPALPVVRRGRVVKAAYHPDLVVEGIIIVEVKAVAEIHAAHDAQIITYLKLSGLPLGYLVNFNAALIGENTHRKLNPDKETRERTCARFVEERGRVVAGVLDASTFPAKPAKDG